MDFQITRQDNHARSVTLVIHATYTAEESTALIESGVWYQPCISEITAWLGFWKDGQNEFSVRNPTFHDLSDPGIYIRDFIPVNADTWANNFEHKFGRQIRRNLGTVLMAFRQSEHRRLESERDQYFDVEQKQLPYFSQKKLPRR